MAQHMIYFLILFVLFSGSEQILDGVIRGSGNQVYGSLVNIIAYLFICLPIAIPLILKSDLSVYGGYIGLAAGALFQTVCFLVGILRMDWNKEADMAQERARVVTYVAEDEISMENSETGYYNVPCDTDEVSTLKNKTSYGTKESEHSDGFDLFYDVKKNTLTRTDNTVAEKKNSSCTLNRWLFIKRMTLLIFLLAVVAVAIWLDIYITQKRSERDTRGDLGELLSGTNSTNMSSKNVNTTA